MKNALLEYYTSKHHNTKNIWLEFGSDSENENPALHKPAYIGMCILELLSKVLMHELHYDYVKNQYGNKSRLLLTDTDSLK